MISNKLKRIFASNGVQVLLCVFMLLFVFDVAYGIDVPDVGGDNPVIEGQDGGNDSDKNNVEQLKKPSVRVTTTTNSVTLTWDRVDNATSYEVTFYGEKTTVTDPTFTASDLTASTRYSFSVVAKGGENYNDSERYTDEAVTAKAKEITEEVVDWDKKYVLLVIPFIVAAVIIIKKHKRTSIKDCQDCGAHLDYNGKCTNPNCPSNPQPTCNICGSNLGTNGKCTNPNCPSNPQRKCNICDSNLGTNGKCTNLNCPSNLPPPPPPPKCNICRSNLGANGKCTNPNCPGKPRICEFCNKIITEAHKQDQLCPSNWINPIKLDKGKILIKRVSTTQGGQGHIHPVWVKDSPIEWLYKNFAFKEIFELERQTLLDLNKERIDFVPIYYREHEKGFIMSKADGDNLNNVFGLKGTKETKQIEKVKIIRFIKKLCDAIEKLHLKGISHRDLKPVNIFYDLGKEKITIIDFGSVAKKEKGNSNSKAPFGDDYKCGKDEGVDFESGKQRDIYAVGIIIKEIWEKSLLEDKQEIYDILYKTTCDNQKERVNITELINLIESKWGALK